MPDPPAAPLAGLVHSHPWHDRRHHRGGGFRTPWATPHRASLLDLTQWLARYLSRRKHNVPPPVRAIDAARLHVRPRRLRITWLGHATLLIQTPTLTLLTDPIFSERASPLRFVGPRRLPALPLEPAALPPIDAVLLSHNHYDHLDRPSAHLLARRFDPLFAAPLGVARHLHRWGLRRTLTMDWGQHVALGAAGAGLRLHCTPAQHFSGRGLLDRNRTLWAGWYLETESGETEDPVRVFFAGDTAYGPHFAQIRERLGAPHVALLPIGANRPRAVMRPVHMNPPEAARAAADLRAAHVVPTHWGTFDLAAEPVQEPPARFRRLMREDAGEHVEAHADEAEARAGRLHLLAVGGSFELGAQHDAQPQPETPASALRASS